MNTIVDEYFAVERFNGMVDRQVARFKRKCTDAIERAHAEFDPDTAAAMERVIEMELELAAFKSKHNLCSVENMELPALTAFSCHELPGQIACNNDHRSYVTRLRQHHRYCLPRALAEEMHEQGESLNSQEAINQFCKDDMKAHPREAVNL